MASNLPIQSTDWRYYNPQYAKQQQGSNIGGIAGNAAGTLGGLKGLFGKAKSGASAKAGQAGSYLKNNFGWNKGSGVTAFGKNVGKAVPWIQGGLGAIQAAQGFSRLSDAQQDTGDATSGILRSAASNPLHGSFLSSDQMSLLNQLRRGNYENTSDFGDVLGGVGSGLGDTAMQTLMGFGMGGIPGAVVGGASGLINSGIQGATQGQQGKTAELEGLYQALMDAESQYRSMRRPNFTGLGIQRQYQNMYG